MVQSFSNLMSDRAVADQARAGAPHGSPEGAVSGDQTRRVKIETRKLDFFYGTSQALFDISMQIPEKSVTALIGPSGCG